MTVTRSEKLKQKGKSENNHSSRMSNNAWCELNKDGTILKLHDKCPKIIFLKVKNKNFFAVDDLKRKVLDLNANSRKDFEGAQTAWHKLLKPTFNVAAPFLGLAVSAKTKNLEVGESTNEKLESISGGKFL